MNEVIRRITRARIASILMACFVVFTPVGLGFYFSLWLGVIAAGVCAGVASLVIGAE